MVDPGESQTRHLPDGSSVKFHVRTDDPRIARIFAADLSRRLRKARRLFTRADTNRSLADYASYVQLDPDEGRSTQVHDLPTGEVTVIIDANGRAAHGYLHYLVQGAAPYTEVLDIDPYWACLLPAPCLGIGVLFSLSANPTLGVPFVGPSGIVAAYVGLYWLSLRGHPLSLTRTPLPANRFR
jgi:hypothetical protein